MSIIIRLLLPFLALPLMAAAPAPTPATAPQLLPPVACTAGQDCWIVHYVDTDAGETAADYRCGRQTYDAHQGTDFAIRDMATMNEGIAVLAAAAGTILRVRDTIDDRVPSEAEIEKMLAENRGCGNGIVLDHGDGWQTIYCHLKKGSVIVKPDDKVTAGQHLAMVGHSGAAEFPHLHFGVFKDSKVIDPFTGNSDDKDCRATQQSMWLPGLTLPYRPASLYAAGFADSAPDYDSLLQRARNPDSLPVSAPALTFWVLMYNAAAGDEIAMRINAPDGSVLAERTLTQEKTRARQYYYVGKRNNALLPAGA
ncbi:MAG: M23 family metallopeptidase, partial [Alphaproteobacteria bacterium]|nr:M23 family metallopeptidase [Alphaproteobacteria bacterium]